MNKNNNIGKLCPLCKKGVIVYWKVKYKDWFIFLPSSTEIECIGCSN